MCLYKEAPSGAGKKHLQLVDEYFRAKRIKEFTNKLS